MITYTRYKQEKKHECREERKLEDGHKGIYT
jgi:hypothetical protein